MRTLFETSWARDNWSPNMGQAAAPGSDVFGDLVQAAGSAVTSYNEAEIAEENRKAAEAKAAAAQAAAAVAAARPAAPSNILGMSPTTAAIVGVATLAAIVGGAALLSKKK